MLEVNNISKNFGTTQAIADLSFSIGKGEVVGLLGPNGAGKTTTMRILANYHEPDGGTVTLDGVAMSENPLYAKRRIGYLPENNPLYPEMSVMEYLTFSARTHGVSKSVLRKALDRAVSLTSLERVVYKPIVELSKGYRQRTGLAAAILHEPDLLILDEPTEGLDPNQRLEIRDLLHRLGRDHTVLLSTHVLSEVQHTCDRLIIINAGKLAAEGSVDTLLASGGERQRIAVEVEGANVRNGMISLGRVRVASYEVHHHRKQLVLEVVGEGDLRPAIFRLAKERGWTLWELRHERKGLEDVFTRLTQTTV